MKKFNKCVKVFMETLIYPICIILFYISGISLVLPLAKWIGNNQIISSLNDSATRVAVDSALISLIINLLLLVLNKPIKISGSFKSINSLEAVLIDLDSRKCMSTAELELNIDYRYKWIKKALIVIGGTSLIIHNTDFTTMQIKERSPRLKNSSSMISSKELRIKLEDSVQERYCKGKGRISFILEPDVDNTEEGSITTEIRPLIDRNKKFRYYLSKIIYKILIEKNIEDLEVKAYKDSE